MASHTPGPWKAPKNTVKDDGVYIADSTGNWDICTIIFAHGPSGEENHANARLISASPELLSALEMVLECDGDLNSMDFDQIRAAVAKAKGE